MSHRSTSNKSSDDGNVRGANQPPLIDTSMSFAKPSNKRRFRGTSHMYLPSPMTCPLIMRPVALLGVSRIDRRHDARQAIFRRADDAEFTRCGGAGERPRWVPPASYRGTDLVAVAAAGWGHGGLVGAWPLNNRLVKDVLG